MSKSQTSDFVTNESLWAQSFYQHGLAMTIEIGNWPKETSPQASALWDKGAVQSKPDKSEIHHAIQHYKQSLRTARRAANRQSECQALHYLALAYTVLNSSRTAIKYYTQGLSMARDLGDQQRECRLLCNLAWIYAFNQGKTKQAIPLCQQALELACHLEHHRLQLLALIELGDIYWDVYKAQQAIDFYQRALDTMQQYNYLEHRGDVLQTLGEAHLEMSLRTLNQGQSAQAIQHFETALEMLEQVAPLHADQARRLFTSSIYSAE